MTLYKNSCLWIHNYENKYEFLIMNSLWRISWNHCWILINEFTYEIMAEFLNLNSISISYELIMWSGKVLVSVLEIMNLSLKSTHCQQEWPSTEPAQQILLGGDRLRRGCDGGSRLQLYLQLALKQKEHINFTQSRKQMLPKKNDVPVGFRNVSTVHLRWKPFRASIESCRLAVDSSIL